MDRGGSGAAAKAVSQTRLWQRHETMGRIGATAKGGVNRQALSAEDAAARALLCDWASARGFAAFADPIGNLFIRREGREPALAPVLTGSHLDSQPTGGRYDGAYGVLAGLEALEALEDAGIATRRAVEVVAWTNEEGSRFQPGTMGSAVFAGAKPLAEMLRARDREGVLLSDALAAALAASPGARPRPLGFRPAAYLEAHIEQGPRLEQAECTIGAVTGIQGARWFLVEIQGDEAHAGTTPLASRRDALRAAVAAVAALHGATEDPDDVLRFTIGRFEVHPGSPNTVPGRVLFSIDLRHPDGGLLRTLGDRFEPLIRQAAGPCEAMVRETLHSPPVRFDPGLVERVRQAAGSLGLPSMDLPSGAGHDAGYMAGLCPTAMIFVPCAGGISHNEAESASPSDLAAGTRVLATVLADLAES